MTEFTIKFQTEKEEIDPTFFENLDYMAKKYGLRIEDSHSQTTNQERERLMAEFIKQADNFARRVGPQTIDSTDIIREERDQL